MTERQAPYKVSTKFEPENYIKVGVRIGGPMHLAMIGESISLCGWAWWFDNVVGTSYCQKCQRIYALRKNRHG